MNPVLCSTGAFSHQIEAESVEQVAAGMTQLRGTAFEVLFYPGWYTDAGLAALDLSAVGADCPVLHVEKSIGADFTSDDPRIVDEALARFTVNCRTARSIGARLLVLHLWELPDADRLIERNLAALPRCADLAEQYGLQLSIETLPCGVSTPLEVAARCLAIEPRVCITLDTAFLALHGQLLASLEDDRLWAAPVGVNHIHLKDCQQPELGWNPRGYLHPGQGTLDLAGFLSGLNRRGYTGSLTLETPATRPDGSPDADQIQNSLAWIREHLAGS